MRDAIGVRRGHWQATVTKHREHCCVVFQNIRLEPDHFIFARNMRQVMQQTSGDPAAPVVFFDNKCNLCAPSAGGIAPQSNDSLLLARFDRCEEDDRAYVVDLC